MQNNRKNALYSFRFFTLLILLLSLFALTACNQNQTTNKHSSQNYQREKLPIIMADGNWDSIQIHNRIAAFIIENGYGYPVEYIGGETLPTWQALGHGDIDIVMEVWTKDNPETWTELLQQYSIRTLGPTFEGAEQGWYVPAYMVEGDVERGIEPAVPWLKSVWDLSIYWQLFDENSDQGLFHNRSSTWNSAAINQDKLTAYKLDKKFKLINTSSDKELANSLEERYEKAKPWLGYGWKPSILTAGKKMILLREPSYSEWQWKNNHGCAYPECEVLIAVNGNLVDKAPEVYDFLSKYHTSLEQNENVLIFMSSNNENHSNAALYFLQQYPYIWKDWLPADVTVRVENALNQKTGL